MVMPLSFGSKTLRKVIELDLKQFPICVTKECAEWQWSRLKNRKFVVHRSKEGFEVKSISV